MNRLKAIWNFFFGFKGRINQYYYLILILFTIPLPYIIHVLSIIWEGMVYMWKVAISPNDLQLTILSTSTIIVMFFIIPVFLAIFKYSLLTKRVHDFNKPMTKTILLIGFVDIITILPLIIKTLPFNLHLISWLISSFLTISLTFIKGDEGDNKFGSPQIPFWKRSKVDN